MSFGDELRFGRYKTPKKIISAISAIFFALAVHGSTSLAKGQHALFEPIFSESPLLRSTATRLVKYKYVGSGSQLQDVCNHGSNSEHRVTLWPNLAVTSRH